MSAILFSLNVFSCLCDYGVTLVKYCDEDWLCLMKIDYAVMGLAVN